MYFKVYYYEASGLTWQYVWFVSVRATFEFRLGYNTILNNLPRRAAVSPTAFLEKRYKTVKLLLSTGWRHIKGTKVQLLSFLTLALGGGTSHTGRFTPGEEPQYPLNRKLPGAQSLFGPFGENKHLLPSLAFEPRIFQSVTESLYLLSSPGSSCKYQDGIPKQATNTSFCIPSDYWPSHPKSRRCRDTVSGRASLNYKKIKITFIVNIILYGEWRTRRKENHVMTRSYITHMCVVYNSDNRLGRLAFKDPQVRITVPISCVVLLYITHSNGMIIP